MLKKIFGKKPYQSKITVEQLNQMLEFGRLQDIGHLQDYLIDEPLITINGVMCWEFGSDNGCGIPEDGWQYRPKHISLELENTAWMSEYITYAICEENNIIQYYYQTPSEEEMRIYQWSDFYPLTDEKTIKVMEDFFFYCYEKYHLPESLHILREKARQKAIRQERAKQENIPTPNRRNKMIFLEKYLATENEDFFDDYFCTDDDDAIDRIAMWIDWKEYDEDAIKYCADVLQCKNLQVIVDENIPEDRGIDVYIIYKDKKTKVPYEDDRTSIDRTLIALNKAISEDYEIRRCTESDGDGMCFVPLTHKQWSRLEKNYPKQVAQKFEKITDDSYFWG